MSVHQGFDNFYNEPPFAERLYNITKESGVPDSAKDEYVKVVTTCYVGNVYGYSRGAIEYYSEMIKSFSPKEIEIMLNLVSKKCILKSRIEQSIECNKRYKKAVSLINPESVPVSIKVKYNKLSK